MKLKNNQIRLLVAGIALAGAVSVASGVYFANYSGLNQVKRNFDETIVKESVASGNKLKYNETGGIEIGKLSMYVGSGYIEIDIEKLLDGTPLDSIMINDNISTITFNSGNGQFILAKDIRFVPKELLNTAEKGVQEYKLNGKDTDFKYITSYVGTTGYAVLMSSSINTENEQMEERMNTILNNASYSTDRETTKVKVGNLEEIDTSRFGDTLMYSAFDKVLSIQKSKQNQSDELIVQEYIPQLFIADMSNSYLGIAEENLVETEYTGLYKDRYFDDNSQFGYRSYAVKDGTYRYTFKIHEQANQADIENSLIDELGLTEKPITNK